METETKITLLGDMISCCHDLYLWTYDSSFHLITSNCPEQTMVNDLFAMSLRMKDFNNEITEHNVPIIFTNDIGLMWVIVPQIEENELMRLYVLGPFLIDDLSTQNLEIQLQQYNLGLSLRQKFLNFLHKLPIISINRIFEYAIMLHFCVTGKKIMVSDLHYSKNKHSTAKDFPQKELTDFHGTYKGEQEMLRMVREGNLNYLTQINKLSMTGYIGKMSNGSPLRQVKNTVLSGITLFTRAAMEGGLAPEIAYTLADNYFQSIEACSSVAELAEIAYTMQDDFVHRVHRCKTNGLSISIQTCCEYISLHLEDKITLAELARLAGYSEYYLGKKFKQELHVSPNEYIRRQRLERAALLLHTTQDEVQDISARLQFCSQSYFADHFRKLYGVSPTAYRQWQNDS
ncbi:MAG: helix-turn-helix domain-containing protein [Lachnospiraceae bacterium]|nr:helix-turn-helix domain-containing protein [Lachnospiraceae bacterium]